jgi:hypothetical protein
MSENIARSMYNSQGTINYPTLLLVIFVKLHHDARNLEYHGRVVSFKIQTAELQEDSSVAIK